jgi:asparagine synthase (glutamine-hydrolysing)
MCGILGQIALGKEKLNHNDFDLLLQTQSSRGPDFNGVTSVNNNDFEALLGHNRLSIIDLSNAANQPMTKDNVWILFNGEIYNYLELKNNFLSKAVFKSHGDTEVILNLYLIMGLDFVDLLEGFFSISILDLRSNKLFLIRDRFGVKPLFVYREKSFIQFASTLFPFNNNRNLSITINNDARNEYFIHGYLRSTGTIYNEVESVRPGSILTFDLLKDSRCEKIYFNLEDYYPKNKRNFDKLSLEQVLFACFKKRMVADVPVGILLSGGVDSNLVALGLSFEKLKNIEAFTVSFSGGNDELDYAIAGNRVHEYKHNIKLFSDKDFLRAFSDLVKIIDQPFGDSSLLPSYIVSLRAREQGFKVLLSADGGDELFFGYNSYFKYLKYYPFFVLIYPLLKVFSFLAGKKVLKPKRRFRNIQLLNEYNYTISEWYYYFYYESIKLDFYDYFQGGYCPNIKSFPKIPFWQIPSISDLRHYLPNDILYKVDRATMAAGVEGREPFLDPELLTIAGSLKLSSMFSRRQGGKLPLKSVLNKYGLSIISNKVKTGFTVNFRDYLFKNNNKIIEYYFSQNIIEKTQILENGKDRNNLLLKLSSDKDVFYNVLVYQIWYIFNFHRDLYIDPLDLVDHGK